MWVNFLIAIFPSTPIPTYFTHTLILFPMENQTNKNKIELLRFKAVDMHSNLKPSGIMQIEEFQQTGEAIVII